MRICVLGSGSGGNCTFIEQGCTRILVDAGLPAKEIVERLSRIGIDASSLDGIFISHEHHDHIEGAGPLARKFRLPVFISARALDYAPALFQETIHFPLMADTPLQLGSLTITPFSTPHDSIDPLAFSLRAGQYRVCVVTDIGYVSDQIKDRIMKADVLVIESNHDLEMLKTGPYPWTLKQRVLSNYGHLSNEALAFFLSEYFDGTERKVMLVHLSRQNNHPQLAYLTASRALEKRCMNTEVYISLQDEISEVLEI